MSFQFRSFHRFPELPSRRNLRIIALIPARYAATRFPGKLMQPLGDKPVIIHTWEAVNNSGLFDDVLVVTDSAVIEEEIKKHGGHTWRSQREHESGSDRIAEAAASLEADVIINVQGDEPFILKESLEVLVGLFQDPQVQVGSLMRPLQPGEEVVNPNAVKVVVDQRDNAMYFSRSPIPFRRDDQLPQPTWIHVGVYGFRKQTLINFTSWESSALEKVEKLEQLRYLEHGVPIRMGRIDAATQAIDAPEDLQAALLWLQKR